MTPPPSASLGVGILAHNEAARLPALLGSLFRQSVFTSGRPVSVACIANGCTDDTAGVARRHLADATAQPERAHVTWMVEELARPGKANAWNHCVHQALRSSDYLCLIDADIVFASDATIASALAVLLEDPLVQVVTDRPMKRVLSESGWLSELSRRFSAATPPGPTEICGQFYCARAAALRTIWLPPGLPVEDGFLRAMIITDEFRAPEDARRIRRADNAAHFFEPKIRMGEVWRHKKRLMIGTTLNHLLFRHLWQEAGSRGAGELLRDELQRDPDWLAQYLARQCERRTWVVPLGHVFRRVRDLRHVPAGQATRRAPAALAATALDLLAAVSANRAIKRNLGLGYW